MSINAIGYGSAMRSGSPRYNRAQIRALLRPGMYQYQGYRGIAFTLEEEEAIIDAYCVKGSAADSVAVMQALVALPLTLRRQQAALVPLRSVSNAYRQAKIPVYLRNQQEKAHDDRRSTQKAPRRTPQPPDTGWHGGSQQVAGTGGSGTHISYAPGGITLIPSGAIANALFYGNTFTHSGISQQQLSAAQGVGLYQNALPPGYLTPYAPPKPLPTEIKAGEIVAWRCWRKRGGKLYSMAMSTTEWMPNVPMTGEPSKSEAEGVHAWKTEYQARKYATDYLGQAGGSDEFLLGTVELWGEVIEHDEGYRAEYAAIKDIVETLTPVTATNPYGDARLVLQQWGTLHGSSYFDDWRISPLAQGTLMAFGVALIFVLVAAIFGS